MILYICGHDFHYEMENLCRVFFPNEKITVSDTLPESGAPEVETYLDGASGGYSVRVRVNVGDKTETRSAEVPKTDEPEKDECERTMARELFSALSAVTGYVPPWGILTGVRPSKLMLKLIESLGEKGAYDYFTKKLLVSEPKARLAQSVAGTEQEIAALGDERSFSLYIAIPFCPSRCSYCSFVSHSITNANAAKLLPVYVDDLCRELEITGKIVRDIGLRLESIYIGGGTPGILSAEQMEKVCSAVENSFDLSAVREYTVELGRPDTVTQEKLDVLRSHSITNANAAKLLPVYVDDLCRELEITGKIVRDIGLRLESIYIGGGTPGILSAEQMEKVCSEVENSFDLSAIREYTVELGRPDTVTQEKLDVLRSHSVDRISINTQTLNDSVLEAVGRKHTAADFFASYALAEKSGFENINVDLIAGLPSDTLESFKKSVDGVVSLAPANITVHALALKSASTLREHGHAVSEGETAGKMIDYSHSVLFDNGYIPYYMYRQSRCVGNLENVGWCKPGTECRYNVFMMEETHTVLAAGAGAVTKLKKPGSNYIERIFNYKYPYEYNARFDTLMERKKRISEFYSEIFGSQSSADK